MCIALTTTPVHTFQAECCLHCGISTPLHQGRDYVRMPVHGSQVQRREPMVAHRVDIIEHCAKKDKIESLIKREEST